MIINLVDFINDAIKKVNKIRIKIFYIPVVCCLKIPLSTFLRIRVKES